MLKTRFSFLKQVPTLIQSPRIVTLKAVCRFVVWLLSTFWGFSISAAGFAFAFGNFVHYCVILLNAPLSNRDEKNVFAMGNFYWEISTHRYWRQVVLLSYWFAVSGGEIISWCDASCLRTFRSLNLAFDYERNTSTFSEFIGYRFDRFSSNFAKTFQE